MSKPDPADQRLFLTDDEQWEAFNTALNRPAEHKPALAELLREPTIFEGSDQT